MEWWHSLSRRRRGEIIRIAIYVTFALLIVALLAVIASRWDVVQDALLKPELITALFPEIITIALKNTIIFTVLGFGGGLIVGLILALMKISPYGPIKWTATVYIEVFRGIPLLVWILLIGAALPLALGIRFEGLYTKGAIPLGLVAGAYMAETIRAGIEAVPRGQMEAARSLGMSYGQAMGSIILPQAFRIIIPPLTNELVLLLKDTSLVSAVGFTANGVELTRFVRNAVQDNANATPMIFGGMVYLFVTIPLTQVARLMERRAARAR